MSPPALRTLHRPQYGNDPRCRNGGAVQALPQTLWGPGRPWSEPDLPSVFRGDWIRVGFCYPRGTTFSILSDVHNRLLKQTSKTGTFMRTFQMDKVQQSFPGRSHYYWDEDSG